jgi:polyisoprenoid-binding protein YceI
VTDSSIASMAVPTGRYRIDPDTSMIRYSSKHMFGLGTVHATFMIRDGELYVGDPAATSGATVTVDAGSFSSSSAKRDSDVRSKGLLDVATYPDITFASDQVRASGDGWLVSGTVTAHGRRVPVEVQVDRVTEEGAGIRVRGRASHLDRTAFGITGSRGMVGRYLDLEVDAFALLV